MTSTPKILIAAQDLPTTVGAGSNYISPANGNGTWIDSIRSVNHSGSTANVTVNIVPNGGSVANSNIAVNAQPIGAGLAYEYPELVGRYIGPGDSIEPFASAASAVNIAVSGRELT